MKGWGGSSLGGDYSERKENMETPEEWLDRCYDTVESQITELAARKPNQGKVFLALENPGTNQFVNLYNNIIIILLLLLPIANL